MTSGSSPRSIAVTIDVRRTPEFIAGLTALRDIQGRARITERIDRLAGGNSGDARSVGDGVSELRLDFGPGYRIDHKRRGDLVVILPCGGDKGSQAQDIERAKAMAREV